MNLQPLLTEYLLENGSLPFSGFGQLAILQTPAVVRESDAMIEPPRSSIAFLTQKSSLEESEHLSGFVRHRLAISQQEASKLLTEKTNLQTAFDDNGQISWPPFGRFEKEIDGEIVFRPEMPAFAYLPDISLHRHKHHPEVAPVKEPVEAIAATDSVDETPESPAKKESWWIWAIIILIVSLLLIAVRYFQ